MGMGIGIGTCICNSIEYEKRVQSKRTCRIE